MRYFIKDKMVVLELKKILLEELLKVEVKLLMKYFFIDTSNG